jgi:hypothetical protein
LYNSNPAATIINLEGRSVAINQILIEAVRGVKAYHVICQKSAGETGWQIDTDLVESALNDIMA